MYFLDLVVESPGELRKALSGGFSGLHPTTSGLMSTLPELPFLKTEKNLCCVSLSSQAVSSQLAGIPLLSPDRNPGEENLV